MPHTPVERAARKRRYERRVALAFDMLGRSCRLCGSTDDLEFDHIDPATKAFTIRAGYSLGFDRFVDEVRKCQVLCEPCHEAKSATERGMNAVKGKGLHGTVSSYRWCGPPRCDACKAAKAVSDHNRRVERGLPVRQVPRHGTLNYYNNFGCRCELCRAAKASAQREYRAKIGA